MTPMYLTPSRRSVLAALVRGATAMGASRCLVGIAGFLETSALVGGLSVTSAGLSGCGDSSEPDNSQPTTPPSSPVPGAFEEHTFLLDSTPALKAVGGVAHVDVPSLWLVVIVIRVQQEKMVSLSRVCPHGACEVVYLPEPGILECPCHGSQFGIDGTLLKGPAERPLTAYATRFDATSVTITSHFPV